ncbi:TPA: hypothetical protein N0F65_012173, partial [Lagenidium giganteum]
RGTHHKMLHKQRAEAQATLTKLWSPQVIALRWRCSGKPRTSGSRCHIGSCHRGCNRNPMGDSNLSRNNHQQSCGIPGTQPSSV